MLQYPHFQADGWPIGIGLVESANKLVVEDRLKGAGMHWTAANVNPMLVLRNALVNKRWEEVWTVIEVSQRQQAVVCRQERRQRHWHRPPVAGAVVSLATPPAGTTPAPSECVPKNHRPASSVAQNLEQAAARAGSLCLNCKTLRHTRLRKDRITICSQWRFTNRHQSTASLLSRRNVSQMVVSFDDAAIRWSYLGRAPNISARFGARECEQVRRRYVCRRRISNHGTRPIGTVNDHVLIVLGHELIAQEHSVSYTSTATLVQPLLRTKRDLCLPHGLAKRDR